LNKAALVRIQNRTPVSIGDIYVVNATHAFPDSFESGLLAGYDPYATPGERGDRAEARAEMARSRYDRNRDGLCDARACRHVLAYGTSSDASPRLAPLDREIARNARAIGISLDVHHGTLRKQIAALVPRGHVALLLFGAWSADFPDGATFAPILQHPRDTLNPDVSLVGATRVQLRKWGYRTRSVPSIDAEIAGCVRQVGEARARCWAELDQRLMERIIPYVPFAQTVAARLTSSRVARYSFDQAGPGPALERIALRPDSR
jgi:hypothetical protein